MAFVYVSHILAREPVTIEPEAGVCEAARKMKENGVGSLVVVKDGEIVGIVTERDVTYKAAARCDCSLKVEDIMTRRVITIKSTASIAEAARLMIDLGIRHLPVVDDTGRLVGVVSLRDLARAIWGMREAPSTP